MTLEEERELVHKTMLKLSKTIEQVYRDPEQRKRALSVGELRKLILYAIRNK